ncbi:MAG: glycosyltransferase family 39 protein [Solirubrobacteraceae bacterium]
MPATAAPVPRRAGVAAALREPHVRWLLLITAAAAALRFAVLDASSYWLDEAFTILILKAPFGHALELIPDTESTPPLYYVLAWGWAKMLGTGEVGVRSLSALFGIATVPFGYAAAARLVDRRTGLIVAALLAFNPFLLWFAQEARAYALLVLLCTIAFHLFVLWLDERRTPTLAAWGIVSALALATHYYAALMIATELAWMLFAVPEARRRVALATIPVLAAGAALVPLAVAQRSNRLAVPLAEESSTVLRTLQVPKQFAVGFDAPAEIGLAVVCLALALAGIALLAMRPSVQRDRVAPAAVVGIATLAIPILLAFVGFDYVSARYEVAGLVPLAICVAAGCAAPRARRAGLALAAALCAIWVGVVVADAADPLLQTRADWRGAAEAVGPVPPGGRAVVLTPAAGRKPFQVYLPDAALLKRTAVSVGEVVLLSVRSSDEESLAIKAQPAGTPAGFLPPGFAEVERKLTRTYALIRYRAPAPETVFLGGLSAGRLDPLPFVALLQRSGRE